MSYTVKQEIANGITHGFGILLSIICLPVLMTKAVLHQNGDVLWGAGIFGLSMLLMYSSSTLYHSLPSETAKRLFKKIDHISIFVLIGGSYTPFLLFCFKDSFGIPFMIVLWSVIAVGSILKYFYAGQFKIVSTIIYLALGWAAVFIASPLIEVLPMWSLLFIGIGGICYTVGTLFYLWKRLYYHHALWHLFVLGGSFSHFVAIYYMIIG